MICVSIGRGRHAMMMAEHKNIVEQGAQLVELRLDFIRRPVDLKRLMAPGTGPFIATCRRPEDRGMWRRGEEERVMLLRAAIANGVEYVDLEMDIAGQIPRYGSTQRIVSYHNFEETPENLEDIHHQITKLDPDVIKIVTMANNPVDNMTALRLCRDSEIPTVAFCMGEMGMVSRILCGKFGAPFTYATFSEERPMAPGQISFEKMNEIYRYEQIDENTSILGVIADPVAHSMSPRIHNAAIRKNKLNMLYLPFRVTRESLNTFLSICPELGVKGLSVTIPHKEKVLKSINVLDDQVAGIKAANTLVFKEHNVWGYNTDCSAAIDSLRPAFQELRGPEVDAENVFKDQVVLLLGAGGVARAIAFGLKEVGAKVVIAARDHRKSEALADALDCESIDWVQRANYPCQGIVNCTPVGMHPNMNETPFDAEWFENKTVVFDTVYNPEQTLFIKSARQAKCITVTGIDMFVGQAMRQFELFTGTKPDQELMRYEVKRAINPAKYNSFEASKEANADDENLLPEMIFLIGYRGSGKSTVGKRLAEQLNWKPYDTDQRIEAAKQTSIAKIFQQQGEAYFRGLETEVIKKLIQSAVADKSNRGRVIALGGGAPTTDVNREYLKGSGRCVWLRGSAATLWDRIANDRQSPSQRPNLTPSGGPEEVKQMLEQRESVYQKCADLTIDVDDLTVQDIVDRIVQWIDQNPFRPASK